ncbi:alpha/beta hydrolase [Pendulispora brunnea]|uniref:Alpha/beta hydrolase n=1 Tax=Pendulispora brunnea TaxID=2905690 RepID=A0ABZ2KL99_9BACT
MPRNVGMVDIKLVRSGNLEIAVRAAGNQDDPAIVLLHGWPQSSRAFLRVMQHLADEFYVLAPDLPGVGGSRIPAASGSKSLLAGHVRDVIQASGARPVVLVGHDVGGMIAFAYLRHFASELRGAAIVDTVIPGLEPAWSKVLSNPRIWHFAFHAIPNLPEVLVLGHQRAYFDFFFDAISRDRKAIPDEARDAYARDYERPDALRAGFDWYRAMSADAEENKKRIAVTTPVLNVRGDAEPGPMSDYLQGLSASGLAQVRGEFVEGSGHFSADEAPDALARILRRFARECIGAV